MVTTYGSFPGVQVSVAGGGITAVAIGAEEKLVIFGEASYQDDSTLTSDGDEDPLESGLTGSLETPEQINARLEADDTFGDDSELANAMKEALANGANIDFLYGVAPRRYNVIDETQPTQSGTLNNAPIWEERVSADENIAAVTVDDDGGASDIPVEFSYDGAPTAPTDTDSGTAVEVVIINPLTGEYAADQAPVGDLQFSYKYLDWESAISSTDVSNVIDEDDTAIYDIISDSDSVSSTASSEVSTLRTDYKLVNVVSGEEPNDNELITSDDEPISSDRSNYTRRDARYDTANYDTANQSIDADYYFKIAPVRLEDTPETILGGVGGLFAGNPLNDPIYNDPLSGYQTLEQSFTKSDADNMRDERVIPVRQAGSIRVKDNLSTSTATDWERDFWRRRITDRIILIGKTIGDTIIGRINDEQTRNAAGRLIRAEIRELVDDRLLRPNTEEDERWFVDVYESSTNPNGVKIDIGFTPYGIVKRVDETITVDG